MGATYNFSLGFAQGTESKAKTPDRLLKRQPLQEICTGMSLVSLCLGFSVFGMLIIVNRHQGQGIYVLGPLHLRNRIRNLSRSHTGGAQMSGDDLPTIAKLLKVHGGIAHHLLLGFGKRD
jgi:hypothetical protein